MKRAFLVALVIGLVAGADDKKDEKKDGEAIKGTWTIVTLHRSGKANADASGGTLTFDGEKLAIKLSGNDHSGTYKLDPSKKPKQIDITPGDGNEQDKVLPGIYSLEKDELKICVAHGGKDRPSEFESKEDSDISLVVLKREGN